MLISLANLKILKYVILLFLGWFISLLIITFLGASLLPTQDFYNKKRLYFENNLQYFERWSNWDGGGFRHIAEQGYVPRLTVFFPLYPMLIKAFMLSGLNSFWAAFLVSQVSTVIALFYFYKLVLLDFDDKVAKRALFALLIFPTGFYLTAIYSESSTLALAISALYYARQKRWLPAAILASLATLTRLAGFAVLIGVILEYLYRDKKLPDIRLIWRSFAGRSVLYLFFSLVAFSAAGEIFITNQILAGVLVSTADIIKLVLILVIIAYLSLFLIRFFICHSGKRVCERIQNQILKAIFSRNLLFLALASLPFGFYLYYQYLTFGSAFTFLKAELPWGRILSVPWQAPLFNLRYILSNPLGPGEFSAHIHVQFAVFIIALICLVVSYYRLRASYTAFFLISLILPLFSGMLADITRFVLIIFPMFLVFALIKNELILKSGTILSLLMLALLSILFINSYFFI